MKTTATVIGIITLFFLSIGTMFKVMSWPGANISLILGVGLSHFFLLLLLIVNIKNESSSLTKASQGVGMFAGWIFSSGILFKIMHWPGANLMLLFGMFFLFFIFLPMYLVGIWQNKVEGKLTTHTIILLAIFSMLMIAYAGKRPTYNILHEYVKISNEIRSSIAPSAEAKEKIYAAFDQKVLTDPEKLITYQSKIFGLKKRSEEIKRYIQYLRIELISSTEGIEANDSTNLFELTALDNNQIPTHFFLADGSGEEGRGYELKKKLDNYRSDILSFIGNKIDIGLNTSDLQDPGSYEMISWAEYHFNHVTLAGAITELASFENDVENAETAVLTELLMESNTTHAEDKSK